MPHIAHDAESISVSAVPVLFKLDAFAYKYGVSEKSGFRTELRPYFEAV
jgi:hypothetical protein